MNKKTGFVSIIGRSNVGKSTLINKIIGQKISIVSNKPQTTRNVSHNIFTNDEGQIVFVDTPGYHNAKTKLGVYMNSLVKKSTKDIDIILFVIETNDLIRDNELKIINYLKKQTAKIFLVINKIDLYSKEDILKTIDTYKNILNFEAIIPISAIKNKNIDALIKLIFKFLKTGPFYYDEDQISNQTEKTIIEEIIREKTIYNLKQEIPYGIYVFIEKMQNIILNKNKIMNIDATIICEKKSHKIIIIGKSGFMIKKIGTSARLQIEEFLNSKVNLNLFVKVRDNWRNDKHFINNNIIKGLNI